MESTEEILADEGMIPTHKAPYNFPNPLALKDQEFDNGFLLKNTTSAYQTPDHKINIRTEQDNSSQYIQLYIPSHRQSIAIEPMTAAADCFNNHLGTKELLKQEHYSIAWIVEELFS